MQPKGFVLLLTLGIVLSTFAAQASASKDEGKLLKALLRRGFWGDLWDKVKDGADTVGDAVSGAAEKVADLAKEGWSKVSDWVVEKTARFRDDIKDAFRDLEDEYLQLRDNLSEAEREATRELYEAAADIKRKADDVDEDLNKAKHDLKGDKPADVVRQTAERIKNDAEKLSAEHQSEYDENCQGGKDVSYEEFLDQFCKFHDLGVDFASKAVEASDKIIEEVNKE